MPHDSSPTTAAARREVIRNGIGIGVATGMYGLSFGAVSTASGLSIVQTCVLSLAMFTGGSQFAFVGVVGAGGAPLAGAATAALLGSRNALYGFSLARVLGVRGLRKFGAAHFVIDESAAMGLASSSPTLSRTGFWVTGLAVFGFWNATTMVGAVGAQLLPAPEILGLDVVAPAAFVALITPRLKSREAWLAAFIGGVVALAAVPLVPTGVPVVAAAGAALALALWRSRGSPRTDSLTNTAVER
jgi:predicted branched-subunit amino acid permease